MSDIYSITDKVLELISAAKDELSKEDYEELLGTLSSDIDGLVAEITEDESEDESEEDETEEESKEESKEGDVK